MILYAHMTIMICFCSCIFFNLQTRSEEWSTSRSTPDSQTISRSRLGADQQSPFLLSLLSLASQDPSTAARGPSQEWLIWLKWAGEKFEALKVLADTKSQWPLRKATGPSELMGIWGATNPWSLRCFGRSGPFPSLYYPNQYGGVLVLLQTTSSRMLYLVYPWYESIFTTRDTRAWKSLSWRVDDSTRELRTLKENGTL